MKNQLIGLIVTTVVSATSLANPLAGSLEGSQTMFNSIQAGLTHSLHGSVIASEGLVLGSKQMSAAGLEALRLASLHGREVVITAIKMTNKYVEISYRAAVTAAEVAQSLADQGLEVVIDSSQQAYEFTIRVSREAFEASLQAAEQTIATINEAAKEAHKVAVKIVYLTREGIIKTADAAIDAAQDIVDAGGIVVGYTLMLEGQGLTKLGTVMTDFGRSLYNVNTQK